MTIKDKSILITGAARGIGLAIAQHLAAQGAGITLADNNADLLALASKELSQHGHRVQAISVDVTRKDQVDAMVHETINQHGHIDALFSNAGIIEVQPFLEHDEAVFDNIMAVNTKGVFLCGQAVARHMVDQSINGRIVNTASLAARVGIADMAAYCASKAATMSLTRSMALALAPHHINVNAIAPGIVDTEMWDKIDQQRSDIHNQPPGEPTKNRVAAIPLQRAALPTDVIGLAAFLLGPGADYITGQTFNVDGGMLPS